MNRSRLTAAVVVPAALALAGLTGLGAHRTASDAEARVDALAAARTRVPALLSYDKAGLADHLRSQLEQTTGPFTEDYRKILTDVVEPTATRRGISTTASLSAAGVVSGDRDEVVVLVFLTQTTTAKDGHSSVSGSRVEVTLKPAGDSWKIAGLKPV